MEEFQSFLKRKRKNNSHTLQRSVCNSTKQSVKTSAFRFIRRRGGMSPRSVPEQLAAAPSRSSAGRDSVSSLSSPHSAPPPMSHPSNKCKPVTPIPPNLLHSAPASPPTPAPSPTPHQKQPNWRPVDEEDEDAFLANVGVHFNSLSNAKKQKFLAGILNMCDMPQLSFVSSYVGPRLRKDPFLAFPTELCLRVRRSIPSSFPIHCLD